MRNGTQETVKTEGDTWTRTYTYIQYATLNVIG